MIFNVKFLNREPITNMIVKQIYCLEKIQFKSLESKVEY